MAIGFGQPGGSDRASDTVRICLRSRYLCCADTLAQTLVGQRRHINCVVAPLVHVVLE